MFKNVIIILVLFLIPSISLAQSPNNVGNGTVYEDGLEEFYQIGLGLLLSEGQESLLNNIENNSQILRAGKFYEADVTSSVDIEKTFKLYNEGKYDEAFPEMLNIARIGNTNAQEAVALMLFNGWGTSKNIKESVRWFKRAAKKLKPLSLYYLGNIYFQGQGVKKDIIEAAMWLNLAYKFYSDDNPVKKRVLEDLENVLSRISLREQRKIQSRVEDWLESHSAAVSAFEKRKKKQQATKENNAQ